MRPHPEPFPRYRRSSWSPWQISYDEMAEDPLQEHEIEAIVAAAAEHDGPAHWRQLARDVHASRWGPGRFRRALRAAQAGGAIRPAGGGRFVPAERRPSER